MSELKKQRRWKLFNYIIKPQNSFKPYSKPKNSPLGPQIVKNDPKIKSNSKVRMERNIENESCSTIWVDPKTVVEPYPNPKNSPLEPQKVKNDPKIKQKLIPELTETY